MIGGETALLAYHKARYTQNHAILSVTDKLHKLYSTSSPLLVWARSTGLEVLNELSPIKGAIMAAAGSKQASSIPYSSTHGGTVKPGWEAASRTVELADGAFKMGKVLLEKVGQTAAQMLTRR